MTFVILAVVMSFCTTVKCDILEPILHWYAPFYSGGGYSSESLAFAKIITAHNITLLTTQHGDSYNPTYVKNMDIKDRELLKRTDTNSYSPGEIAICHSEPGAWHAPFPKYHTSRCPPSGAAYTIGRTMFETDRIPSGWSDRLNIMDEIWVPSEFSANIFQKYGVVSSKIVVVEEPVDTEFYHPLDGDALLSFRGWMDKYYPSTPMQCECGDDDFVFLFVGKWEQRKGVQLLLRAFFGAFASYDAIDVPSTTANNLNDNSSQNVLLVVVTSAYHSTSDFHSEISKYLREEGILMPTGKGNNALAAALLERIVLLSDVPQSAMTELYNAADVLVIPSRGEGWGRPHVEAMACGIPVLATNWSGVTAYLTEENGYPLAVDSLVPASGWAGHQWAEPSVQHLQQLLRHVYLHRNGEVKEKGIRARETMVQRYSYSAFAPILLENWKRILERCKEKGKRGTSKIRTTEL